jgi:hypothetical protein
MCVCVCGPVIPARDAGAHTHSFCIPSVKLGMVEYECRMPSHSHVRVWLCGSRSLRVVQIWVGLLGVAIAMWMYLRRTYTMILCEWRTVYDDTARTEAADSWASTRRGQWAARRQLLKIQRQAFAAVVKPLEPYVILFVLFGVPVSLPTYLRSSSPQIGCTWLPHTYSQVRL